MRPEIVLQRDTVLAFIGAHPRCCDDCVAEQLGIQPRQSVNLHARSLADSGATGRVLGACVHCQRSKIVNSVAEPLSGQSVAPHRNELVPATVRGAPAILDGANALERVLERAGYSSVAHAIAEHTVFLHPDTVKQTRGEAVLPVVRSAFYTPRATVVELEGGRRVWADDNGPPTYAFLWAAGSRKGPDVQFNHVWPGAASPNLYTALWNLVRHPCLPGEDHRHEAGNQTSSSVPRLCAVWPTTGGNIGAGPYGTWLPTGELNWAASPVRSVKNLEAVYRTAMRRAPKNRATIAARELGWLFSDWKPDASL